MAEMDEDQVVVEEDQVVVEEDQVGVEEDLVVVAVVEELALNMVVSVRTLIFLYHVHQACPGHPDP